MAETNGGGSASRDAANGAGAGGARAAPLRQWPAAEGVAALSPLAHVGLEALAARETGDATVRFTERPVTGLLVLRGDAGSDGFVRAVREATGLELPARLRSTSGDADGGGAARVIRWRSPDEWLLSCPIEEAHEITVALERAFDASACVVDVSGGYTLIELAGKGVDAVLARSTAYDATGELPPGKVVSTAFAKSAVMLRRIDAGRVELVVRRSFADYVWTWLQRAARPGGLAIESP